MSTASWQMLVLNADADQLILGAKLIIIAPPSSTTLATGFQSPYLK
jgi:hypothetical protein